MFKAVRESFAKSRGWIWTAMRERRIGDLAGLFLFELLVVTLGVLMAQQLADWAEERGERKAGRELYETVAERRVELDRVVNYWHDRGSCLRTHVQSIAKAAGEGRTMTAAQIGRPGFPIADHLELSEVELTKIRKAFGPRKVAEAVNTAWTIQAIDRYAQQINEQWLAFQLLDPAFGNPTDEDRSRIRMAAAVIDSRLRWMVFNKGQYLQQSEEFGAKVDPNLPDSAGRMDRCGRLKDWDQAS